jgi:uncharacterized membrane protein YesL
MSAVEEEPGLNGHTYVRLTAASWWQNLPLVLLSGALFTLSCAPAVVLLWVGPLTLVLVAGALTIAPAWAALLAVERKMVEGRKATIGMMLRAFPRYWTRTAALGVLIILPALAGLLTLPALARPEVPWFVWLGLAADGFVLLLIGCLYLYAFPLIVLYDVSVRDGLRNGFILASRNWINTIGLVSMLVLLGFATVYLSSGLLFFWPAFWSMFVLNNCRLVVAEELG